MPSVNYNVRRISPLPNAVWNTDSSIACAGEDDVAKVPYFRFDLFYEIKMAKLVLWLGIYPVFCGVEDRLAFDSHDRANCLEGLVGGDAFFHEDPNEQLIFRRPALPLFAAPSRAGQNWVLALGDKEAGVGEFPLNRRSGEREGDDRRTSVSDFRK